MARERSPHRDKAEKMWLESGGAMLLKDIAAALGLGETQIRKWKSQDKWASKLKSNVTNDEPEPNSNVTKRKGRGGAPKGNQNAKGNRGGKGGPFGNKKAVKTGEFETIWLDTLDEEEQDLLDGIDTDPVVQADEAIALLAFRERRMLKRIQRLTDGLTEKQRTVLRELRTVKEAKPVTDPKTGKETTIVTEAEKMVVAKIETTTIRVLEDILRIEDALTRVQAQKLKAIELKNRLIAEDEEKQIRTEILRIELQQLQGGAGATQSWTEALKDIAERRKAKRAEQQAAAAAAPVKDDE